MTPNLLDQLETNGYVLIPSILTPSQLSNLRAACAETTSFARTGHWPHVRTLPKQFPPWPTPNPHSTNPGIWGVQSLMHPSLPRHALFTQTYFSSALLDPAKELMQCTDIDLVMELFNLLVRPDDDFELRWHRDDVPDTATPEQELERLGEPAWHCQWNLALYDDESLIVVPRSHTRARTEKELNAGKFDVLEGQLAVKMAPGDVVFYNNNILHRGAYDSGKERMTLHGSVGHAGGSKMRARNVLQHGVGEWIGGCGFGMLEGEDKIRAEGMKERLVEMGRDSGHVGYSLEG